MLAESVKVITVYSDQDLSAAATMPGTSIDMSLYHDCLFVVGLQTLGEANPDFTVYAGATSGATTAKIPFKYTLASAAFGAAGASTYAAWTTKDPAGNVTLAHASDDNKTLLISVDAKSMGGYRYLTLQFEDTAIGATGNVQAHAILTPRYKAGVDKA